MSDQTRVYFLYFSLSTALTSGAIIAVANGVHRMVTYTTITHTTQNGDQTETLLGSPIWHGVSGWRGYGGKFAARIHTIHTHHIYLGETRFPRINFLVFWGIWNHCRFSDGIGRGKGGQVEGRALARLSGFCIGTPRACMCSRHEGRSICGNDEILGCWLLAAFAMPPQP